MIATVNHVTDHKLFLDERDALVFLSSYRQHLEHEKHHRGHTSHQENIHKWLEFTQMEDQEAQ